MVEKIEPKIVEKFCETASSAQSEVDSGILDFPHNQSPSLKVLAGSYDPENEDPLPVDQDPFPDRTWPLPEETVLMSGNSVLNVRIEDISPLRHRPVVLKTRIKLSEYQ